MLLDDVLNDFSDCFSLTLYFFASAVTVAAVVFLCSYVNCGREEKNHHHHHNRSEKLF